MTIIRLVGAASIFFALLAAVLWLKSASIKTPEKVTVGYGGSGGSVQELGDAIICQSKWSAYAAYAAAASAGFQAVAGMLPS